MVTRYSGSFSCSLQIGLEGAEVVSKAPGGKPEVIKGLGFFPGTGALLGQHLLGTVQRYLTHRRRSWLLIAVQRQRMNIVSVFYFRTLSVAFHNTALQCAVVKPASVRCLTEYYLWYTCGGQTVMIVTFTVPLKHKRLLKHPVNFCLDNHNLWSSCGGCGIDVQFPFGKTASVCPPQNTHTTRQLLQLTRETLSSPAKKGGGTEDGAIS